MWNYIKKVIGMGNKQNWLQGEFTPQHPEKCINSQANKKIIYRSSWELRIFNWADQNKNVKRWGSEIIKIPYIFDLDKAKGVNKLRNYWPDLYAEIINKDGELETFLIEVKPIKQKQKPKRPKNLTKKAISNYNVAMSTYIQNMNKWKYARVFCEGKNWKFKTLTENDIFKGESKNVD